MNMAEPRGTHMEPFINRELSLLEFNQRVLALATDPALPLLERLRFLCISSSNLDEFFEIRVAGLKQLGELGTPVDEQLAAISVRAAKLIADQYRCLNTQLLPELNSAGVRLQARDSWPIPDRDWLEKYFHDEVEPVLSPLGLDPARPFPRIQNKSLNFVVRLEGKDAFGRDTDLAIVQVPRSLPRVVRVANGPVASPWCCCRTSSRNSFRCCSRAWWCMAAIRSASRATATCSWTRRKSTTCAAHWRASWPNAATARRCGWRPRWTARKTSRSSC
jgi:polyphosphate kinase